MANAGREEKRHDRVLSAQDFFFPCIAGLVRDLVGQQLEWACDWKQISPKKETNKTQQNKQQKQPTHTSQGESQAKQSGKFAN